MQILGGSHRLNGIALTAFVALMFVALASCGGLGAPPQTENGAGNGLDLVGAVPLVSDSGPAAGAKFTLSATVHNIGNRAAAAATLRFYRSTDATITTSDTEVGRVAVGELGAVGSGSASVEVAAPSTPGTYYYGVCVDVIAGESDTTNNCSTSVQVDVRRQEPASALQGDPDLTVYAVLAATSPSGTPVGGTFTLSAGVRNDGGGAAATTTLRFFQSTDATITTSDTEVGTDAVPALAASGSDSASAVVTAPSTSGTYYYGACVVGVDGESDTTNNCSTAVQVEVEAGAPPPQRNPDLMVVLPAVSDGRPAPGAAFTLSATVQNVGDAAAAITTLRYYRSTDSTITISDTAVGTDTVSQLAASRGSDQSVDVSAPSTPGTYYYGACVDAVADESDTTNNCSTFVQVIVPAPPGDPDLAVALFSVSDSYPAAGAALTLSATVQNIGDGAAPGTMLRYYRSADATITASDTEVGNGAVVALAASGSSSESAMITAPSAPGTYYYGACVDAMAVESDTTNNCSTSVPIIVPQVQPPAQGKPDLTVYAVIVATSPWGTPPGGLIQLSVGVRNAGDVAAAATPLHFYQSTDPTITRSDTEVGTGAVPGLGPSEYTSEGVGLSAPSTPGTYYYGACVNAVANESDTTNNCSGSVPVEVS